jgi:hypothetical protein
MQSLKLILDAFRGVILCSQKYGFVITAILVMAGRFT